MSYRPGWKKIDGVWVEETPEEQEEIRKASEQAEREQKEQDSQMTDFDRLEAQTLYTALMTDTLLEEE